MIQDVLGCAEPMSLSAAPVMLSPAFSVVVFWLSGLAFSAICSPTPLRLRGC